MTVDTTLTFAARRNIPIRYSRPQVQTTLKAMSRVAEIQQKRERVFYKKRMEGNKARELENDKKLVAENSHLLPRMRGSERKRLEEAGEEVNEEDELVVTTKAKVFGVQNMGKRKVRVDGVIEGDDEMDMN